MEKKFLREIACVFIICLMLNLSFYPGFAEEGMPSSTGNATTAPAPTAESRTQFNCKTPESNPEEKVLKPEEVLKLKEKTEIESDGINIDKIDTGKGSNPDRADSTVDMVVQTTDNNSAILNEVPDKKMDLGEVPWLKKYIQGPFAFGVSLYDTVRIGQCRNLSELEAAERGCPLTDKQLSLRNSGYGISNNFKNVYNDVKDFVTDDILGNPKETGQYTKEELEQLQLNLLSEDDLNTLEAKTVSRNVEHIPNSVKAEGFKADMATNCSENSCLISSYSFFDKYFNSWFSAEMVISNFGPTLLGQAKRYMGWMRRRGWP
ncbi:MAG: hypothetical protein JW744_04740, partial [Candidatus Diapherotrites archaeon]|nr:hypothetical protein [Candidatus Diapherotrites archaeon]